MRPKPIVYFELIMIGALLIASIELILTYPLVRDGLIAPLFYLLAVLELAIWILLTFLTSRKASYVASILLRLFALASLLAIGEALDFVSTALAVAIIARTSLQIVAAALLFAPGARTWLRNRGKTPPALEETFT